MSARISITEEAFPPSPDIKPRSEVRCRIELSFAPGEGDQALAVLLRLSDSIAAQIHEITNPSHKEKHS